MKALGPPLRALAACGDDEPDTQAEPAGTYRLDKDAMRGRWITAYDQMVDAKHAALPTADLRERKRSQVEAAKAKFREQFEKLDVTLALDAAGTWTLRGSALEGPLERSGTWSLSGADLTFVHTSAGARSRNKTTTARYENGVIHMRPEPGLPEQMIFRRD